MRYRCAFSLKICLIFFFVFILPEAEPVQPGTPQNQKLRLLQSNENGLIVEIDIPSPEQTSRKIGQNTYEIPQIQDFATTNTAGLPMLPQKGILLGIPYHAAYEMRILEVEPEMGEVCKIPPAPIIFPSSENEKWGENFKDPIYSINQFFPATWAVITDENIVENLQVIRVQINPLRYNPVTNQVVRISYLKFEIRFLYENDQQTEIVQTSQRNESPILKQILLNYQSAKNWQTPKPKSYSRSNKLSASAQPQFKIEINDAGIYRLNYEWLVENSIPAGQINPLALKITNKGNEIPLRLETGTDNSFDPGDYFEFFAQPNRGDSSFYDPYSDTNIYWLTWDGDPGLRMRSKSSIEGATRTISSGIRTLHIEKENIYHSGDTSTEIIDTEQVPSEGWIWRFLYAGEREDISFSASHLPADEKDVTLRIRFHGITTDAVNPDHHLRATINQQTVGEVIFDNRAFVTLDTTFNSTLLNEGSNLLRIYSLGDLGAQLDQVYLDWVEFDIPVVLEPDSNGLTFQIPEQDAVSQFSLWNLPTNEILIYDETSASLIEPLSLKKEKQFIYTVTSAASQAGNYAKIAIDNNYYVTSGRRGFNVLTINHRNGEVQNIHEFDTYFSTDYSDSLAIFISNLEDSTIVLAGIRDEGFRSLTENGILALESIGSQYIRDLQFADSWAIIGWKGAPIGSVTELLKPNGTGVATIVDTVLIEGASDTWHLVFADSVFEGKQYFLATPQSHKQPVSIKAVTSADLANPSNGADLIIITHPEFKTFAEKLAAHRESTHNIRVKIVYIEDIFNEFNFGLENPGAVREFLTHAYYNWQSPPPSAVCILGDASWDLKMNSNESTMKNYVLSYGNPVSDSWFVCVNGPDDYLPDMAIGRIAAQTAEEADAMINKIIEYDNLTTAKWQKEMLFLTGGFNSWEQNLFMTQSEELNNTYVTPPPSSIHSSFINKSTEGQIEGENKPQILAAINSGKLWVNFLGHAGSHTWDLMFNEPDVAELTNSGKYPFISSMTCHTARFANPEIPCFGELFTNSSEKGAIAFWGTSGWGYLEQDYILLQKLFPTMLTDTLHTLGEATRLAKLDLFEKYGGGQINKSTIFQYALIGDPLTELRLSKMPDLLIESDDVNIIPEYPIETDSIATISIQIKNWGLIPEDSVEIQILDAFEAQSPQQIGSAIKIPPVGFMDSVNVNWPINSRAGEHILYITIDPQNKIQEENKNNNQLSIPVFVYSSMLVATKPANYQIVTTKKTDLQVNTPVYRNSTNSDRLFQFEIDSAYTFNSPALVSASISEGNLVTRWKTPVLADQTTYFWRCRLIEGNDVGKWVNSSFTTDFSKTDYGISLHHPYQRNDLEIHNLIHTDDGVELALNKITLEVSSGGMSDGDFARIFVDGQAIIEPTRGINVAILDPITAEILVVDQFDTWNDPEAADEMAMLLNALETGIIVCAAIKDEGSRYLTETLFSALETVGSQHCRQISLRDSWALIGRKGATIGSVPEMHTTAEQGSATVVDTLKNYATTGNIISPFFGPANQWTSFEALFENNNAAPKQTKIIGYNNQTANYDTIGTTQSDYINLFFIDSEKYSKIKFRTTIHRTSDNFSPVFKGWNVSYIPAPDLATSNQLITLSADSVIEGDVVNLQVQVHNFGFSPADSFAIKFEASSQLPTGSDSGSIYIKHLMPDSSLQTSFQWSSHGKDEQVNLKISLAPAENIHELYLFNNEAVRPVFVKADTSRPNIKFLFDGNEINDGNWVAATPQIAVQIYDNSPVLFEDTSKVQLWLDNEPVTFLNNDKILSLIPEFANNPSGLKATLNYKPKLNEGEHVLEIIVRDFSQNTTYERISFIVSNEFKLLNVLNYPNPFKDCTNFTYILTQHADDVKIGIYTVAGRLIKTIENAPGDIGFNQLLWDGLDTEGNSLANGVYLYKITAKQNDKKISEIQKLIHIY